MSVGTVGIVFVGTAIPCTIANTSMRGNSVTDREANERINQAFKDGILYGLKQAQQNLDILFALTKGNVNIFDYTKHQATDLNRENKPDGK